MQAAFDYQPHPPNCSFRVPEIRIRKSPNFTNLNQGVTGGSFDSFDRILKGGWDVIPLSFPTIFFLGIVIGFPSKAIALGRFLP